MMGNSHSGSALDGATNAVPRLVRPFLEPVVLAAVLAYALADVVFGASAGLPRTIFVSYIRTAEAQVARTFGAGAVRRGVAAHRHRRLAVRLGACRRRRRIHPVAGVAGRR